MLRKVTQKRKDTNLHSETDDQSFDYYGGNIVATSPPPKTTENRIQEKKFKNPKNPKNPKFFNLSVSGSSGVFFLLFKD